MSVRDVNLRCSVLTGGLTVGAEIVLMLGIDERSGVHDGDITFYSGERCMSTILERGNQIAHLLLRQESLHGN